MAAYSGKKDIVMLLDQAHPDLWELKDKVRRPPPQPKALILIGLVTRRRFSPTTC